MDSILRKKVRVQKSLTDDQAGKAFIELFRLPIHLLEVEGQRKEAWRLATEIGFPTVYDGTYLALASLRGCEFWTADERLYNQVKERLVFVRWLHTQSSLPQRGT